MTEWRFSPTQLRKARCLRQWAYSYRSGIPGGTSTGREIGDLTHRMLEAFSRDGADPSQFDGPPKLTKIAARLAIKPIDQGMMPEGDSWPEERLVFEAGGVVFAARIDLIYTDGDLVVARDYKTTGHPDYAMLSDELPHDEQAIICLRALLEIVDAPTVAAEWLYIPKNKVSEPAFNRVWIATRDEVEKSFQRLLPRAQLLQKHVSKVRLGINWINTIVPSTAQLEPGGTCDFCDYASLCTDRDYGHKEKIEWQ